MFLKKTKEKCPICGGDIFGGVSHFIDDDYIQHPWSKTKRHKYPFEALYCLKCHNILLYTEDEGLSKLDNFFEKYYETLRWLPSEEYVSQSKLQHALGLGFDISEMILRALVFEKYIDNKWTDKGLKVLKKELPTEEHLHEQFGVRFDKTPEEVMKSVRRNKVVIGEDVDFGTEFVLDFGVTKNLLLGGTTGSGKSICLHNILVNLLNQNRTAEFYLLDPKRVEYSKYKDLKNVHIFNELEESVAALNKLADSIDIINHDVFVIIDEISDYIWNRQRKIEKPILKLLENSKDSTIRLIIASQTLEYGAKNFKSLIPDRLGFSCVNSNQSKNCIGRTGCENLKGQGDCLAKISDRITHIQVDFFDKELRNKLLEELLNS